jgi:hypothetical protein
MAQTSRNDSFELVLFALTTFFHSTLVYTRCLIVSNEKIKKKKKMRTNGPNESKRLV